MIVAVLILFGVLLGVLGSELVRRVTASAGNPMLDSLRATLEEMERDYRLRVATEELAHETAHIRPIRSRGPDRPDGGPG